MKAQEKAGTEGEQIAVKDKKTIAVAGKRGRPSKKRKVDIKEEPESEGEEDAEEDVKQLHPSLEDTDQEGEKV